MATKVNTKFVMFLIVAVAVAAGLIAGLYWMNVRGSVARAVRAGDQAMEAGDLRAARDAYGRAVHKEPSNLSHVAKLEAATLGIRPNTASEARELYQAWLALLLHVTRYDSANVDAHLRVLEEFTSAARRGRLPWGALEDPADEMWQRIPETEPKRWLAKVYKGISVARRGTGVTLDELSASADEMREVTDHLPNSDLAWATLLYTEISASERLRDQGRPMPEIEAQIAKLDQLRHQAIEAVHDGVETAQLNLLTLLHFRLSRKADGQPFMEVTDEDLLVASDRLEALLEDQEVDPPILSEATAVLSMAVPDGTARSIDLMTRYLEANPRAEDVRLQLVRFHINAGQLEEAEATAMQIIESEPLTVGILAQIQSEIRKSAAAFIVDIQTRRHDVADADDRPQRLAAIEEARDRLAQLARDENDPQLLLANARLAYIKRDFQLAARLYEQLLTETPLGRDPETLYFAAVSLEQMNQIGRAYERIVQALALSPRNVPLIVNKARLELNLGRRADAAETIKAAPQEALAQSEELQRLVEVITAAGSEPSPLQTVDLDEVQAAQARAQIALGRGDEETARREILSALEKSPQNVSLLINMIMLETRQDQQEKAREYLDRALAIDPSNLRLLQFDAMLRHDDPIVAIRELLDTHVPDEKTRILTMLNTLRSLRTQQAAILGLLGDESSSGSGDELAMAAAPAESREARQKARDLLDRCNAEVQQWMQRADRVMADDPRYIEFQLADALADSDWARAEAAASRSQAVNADGAGGTFHRGQVILARAQSLAREGKAAEARTVFQDAVRMFERATDRLGFVASAWKALAAAHQGLGNFAQVERALEQAYKCNPNDLEVLRGYYSALIRRGDQAAALRILRHARQLMPTDAGMRNSWLQLEAEVGDRLLALRLRRELAEDIPDDYGNALELARLLSSTEPSRESIVDASGTPIYNEQRWARLTVDEQGRALRQAKAEWERQSDRILASLASRMGQDLRLASARASILQGRGDVEEGEKVLREFISSQGDEATTAMALELARYQVRASLFNRAVQTLEGFRDRQDPQVREIDRELGQVYMRVARFDQALEYLDRAIETMPDRGVQTQAIECLIKIKRFDEAEQRLTKLVESSGEDTTTVLLAASMAEGRGSELYEQGNTAEAERKFAEQRDAYVRAHDNDPSNITPLLLQAQWYLAEFRRTGRATSLGDALHALDNADKIRAGVPDVSMTRVAVLGAQGDQTAVIGELRRLLERHPNQHAARRELVQVYVRSNQHDAAIAALNEGIRNNPAIGMWHEALGDMYFHVRRDASAALTSYNRAFDLTPSPGLLLKIADLMLASSSPDCRTLAQRVETRPADLERFPQVREVYARALHCLGRRDEALSQLRLAYERRKELVDDGILNAADVAVWFKAVSVAFESSTAAGQLDASAAEQFILELCGGEPDIHEIRALAAVWTSAGDPTYARAIEWQTRAIEAAVTGKMEDSLVVDLHGDVASMYFVAGRYQDAAATYAKMLEIDSGRLDVLNNFAYLTANELGDPKAALPYAERALELAPENSAVLDTMGWVHHLDGNYEVAEKYLRDSLQLAKSVTTRLHLAETLLMLGRHLEARQVLEEASRSSPDQKQINDINRLAEAIRQASGSSR